jgi:uncharacterized membrane protein
MTSPAMVQPARVVFGEAWVADGESARATLAGLLGLQITLIGLVLSASTTALYGLVAHQSLRLVRFVAPTRPFLRALVGFAVTTGYVLASARRLGPPELEAPRPVVTVGVLIAITALVAVLVDAALALRKQELAYMLRIVTTATRRAIRVERARATQSSSRIASEANGGVPLRAHRSGYLVDVAARRMLRDAVRFDVRVRVDRAVGDFVSAGEPVGVVRARSPLSPRAMQRLAGALQLDECRSPERDVGAGLRVLVDIAERALSPGVNDPYTACEVLYHLRGVIVELACLPDGAWVLTDDAGTVRVAIARPSFEEWLRLALDGPRRYGAGDPDVLDAVLDIAAAVSRVPSRRESARGLVARVLEEASSSGMSPDRRALLHRKGQHVLADTGGSAATPRLGSEPATVAMDALATTAVHEDGG